jgi:hypothetical protein
LQEPLDPANILTPHDKVRIVEGMCERYDASRSQCVAYGDSMSDAPHCDPDIPPIPPHAEFEQIKDAAEAMIKGDPDAVGVVKKGLRTKGQEIFTRRGQK